METHETESSQEPRGETDKSLKAERVKTDEYLKQKSKTVAQEAIKMVRLDRLVTDTEGKRIRAKVDLDKKHQREVAYTTTSPADDRIEIQERERSDNVKNLERKKRDRVWAQARFQKRLIAEAFLEHERAETDSNLLKERVRIDFESNHTSKLLSDETVSHEVTKAAVVTRDQFLTIVSHDLQSFLVSSSLAAHLMRKDLSQDAVDTVSLLGNLGIIEQSNAAMDRMISALLDVERMAEGKLILKLERVDLRALLHKCVNLFAPVVSSKSFSMTIQPCPEPIYADLDQDRILQVLSNLIGNALKFTPKGGTITLSARKQEAQVELSITDNGPGIPEQEKARIFDQFSQLNSQRNMNNHRGLGLGLGLFIAKWIVDAHKGRIWVTSDVGKGSTFSLTLPLSISH